jgi:monothiol glutaredoxin
MTSSLATTEEVLSKIKQQIAAHPIILYMKGSPEFPQCGFSSRAVQCIKACGFDFASVDVLANPEIRQYLPQIANWPTFPQLYVKGELIGGSDIISELFERGELEVILRSAASN